MSDCINQSYDPELIKEILDYQGPYENDEESICRRMVEELTLEEQETAACTSYAYLLSSKVNQDNLSENTRKRSAMKEARRVLIDHKHKYDAALENLKFICKYRKEKHFHLFSYCFTKDTKALERLSDEERAIITRYEKLLESEMEIQPMAPLGHDRENRTIIHRSPRRKAECDEEAYNLLVMYMAERGNACVEHRTRGRVFENVAVLHYQNYNPTILPPTKIISGALSLLQELYRGRIVKAILLEPPFWFRAIFALLSPFLSSEIRDMVSLFRVCVFVRAQCGG